jgi:tyrosinase
MEGPMESLDERAARLLKTDVNERPVVLSPEAAKGTRKEATTFSVFLPGHQQKALALAARFMEIANTTPGDAGLERVLDEADRALEQENSELVRYALMVFITHHPEGRRLPIPPLDERTPYWTTPSNADVRARGVVALGALGAEAKLDYFREDTGVNDHHGKWHVVYPHSGFPDPQNPEVAITKDRQGELFWYMHQQMLARYDAERRALGLARVKPLEDYRTSIAEGYMADLPQFSDRPPNAVLHDLDGYPLKQHELRRDRLVAAAKEGKVRSNAAQVAITPVLFGDTIEANVGSADGPDEDPNGFYGQLHNMGHALLAELSDPNGAFPNRPGVMTATTTAVRDPVFFRWHKHVDDIFVLWQSTLPPYDFSADAPPVRIRQQIGAGTAADASPDIIFCRASALPKWGKPDFDGQQLGEATFGGAKWDAPGSDLAAATDELTTFMRQEQIRLSNGSTVTKPYLDHEEFAYFLRLQNLADAQQQVTVRVFIAPAELAADRRAWIEMDKFTHTLGPQKKDVVFRWERQSSVVRKPAWRPSEPKPTRPRGAVDMNYCDCGWPLHVFLPRGIEKGMEFVAFVMLTDFEHDMVDAEKKCGSMSFCGARDARYPDKRPMGYPFDRPFTARSIADTVKAQQNMATRKFNIRHTAATV